MALPKPTLLVDWVPSADPAKIVEPSGSRKTNGYIADGRPPAVEHNWIFHVLWEWTKYLESVTDSIIGSKNVVVRAAPLPGEFATLQAAHDDAGTVPGTRILIVSDLSLDATQSITKPDIDISMRPGFRFIKGGGAPATNFVGVQIGATADRIKLNGLNFGGASAPDKFSGAGDEAMNIDVGANNVFLFNPNFVVGNTTDLQDDSATTTIIGPQTGLLA